MERGEAIPKLLRNTIKLEISEIMFMYGIKWNKSKIAQKYNISRNTVYELITEINTEVKYKDYHLLYLIRLEKQRTLIVEQLLNARLKGNCKDFLAASKELREIERLIFESRIKMGLITNEKRIINYSEESSVPLSTVSKILGREIFDV